MKGIDTMNATKPFGGKTIVFGGNFHQILLVIPKERRQDIVNAAINSSFIRRNCQVLRLTKNMRLQRLDSNHNCDELKKIADWIANVGDSTIGDGDDGSLIIEIPTDMFLENCEDLIVSIVESTCPSFAERIHDPEYLQQRVILAPTLDVVDSINQYMISKNTGDSHTYYSSNNANRSDVTFDVMSNVHMLEFLNSIKCSGISNHELILKVGTPIMLLRNIDPSLRLCDGTRLTLTRLGSHLLEANIMTGTSAGHKVLIPRLSLTPSDPKLPFAFLQRQFSLTVSYAMTINKSQGQSLSNVGLFLRKPLFTHGQLYVSFSGFTNQ